MGRARLTCPASWSRQWGAASGYFNTGIRPTPYKPWLSRPRPYARWPLDSASSSLSMIGAMWPCSKERTASTWDKRTFRWIWLDASWGPTGLSVSPTHQPEEVTLATRGGADYIGFGLSFRRPPKSIMCRPWACPGYAGFVPSPRCRVRDRRNHGRVPSGDP